MNPTWTASARETLRAIQDEVAEDQPTAARRITQRIVEASQFVSMWPGVGRSAPREGVRTFPVPGTNYLLAYYVSTNEVSKLTIFHGARDWQHRFPA